VSPTVWASGCTGAEADMQVGAATSSRSLDWPRQKRPRQSEAA
jgi:hypothetical protein